MKKILAFAAVVLWCAACGRSYNISGYIDSGSANDTLFVKLTDLNSIQSRVDTVVLHQGKLRYNVDSDQPTLLFLFPCAGIQTQEDGSQFISEHQVVFMMWCPGERLKIKAKLQPDFMDYQISGSVFNEDYSRRRMEKKDLTLQIDRLTKAAGEAYFTDGQKLTDSLAHIADRYIQERNDFIYKYINSHLDRDLAVYYMIDIDDGNPADTLIKYYDLLSQDVKEGPFSTFIELCIAEYREEQQQRKASEEADARIIGSDAPGFTLQSLQGKTVSLQQLKKGKYLVLDFWGSWCIWCLRGAPDMVATYEKYASKVEFVGIACNDKKEDWQKAISEYNLHWTQLFCPDEQVRELLTAYNISGFPTKVILDSDLKVVAKFAGENPKFYQKIDELFNQ